MKKSTRIKFLDSKSKEFISRKLKDVCHKVVNEYNDNPSITSPVLIVGKFKDGNWDTSFKEGMTSIMKADLNSYADKDGVLDLKRVTDKFYEFITDGHEEQGASAGMSIEDIAKKHGVPVEDIEGQIVKGMSVETEHTDNPEEAKKIAMDHLVEMPDYYDRLIKMESEKTSLEDADEDEEVVEETEEDTDSEEVVEEDEEEEPSTYREYLEKELETIQTNDFRYYLMKIILGQDKGWSYLKKPEDLEGNKFDVVTPKNIKKIIKIFKESKK